MGKKLHLRQRVVATASIYFRRLYLTYSAPTLNFTMCQDCALTLMLSVGVRRSSCGGPVLRVCRNSFVEYDPRLFAPGCLYLASKIEECMTHAKQFASQANEISTLAHARTHTRHCAQGAHPLSCVCGCAVKNNWPYTMNDILESEYFIMEEMNFKMVRPCSTQSLPLSLPSSPFVTKLNRIESPPPHPDRVPPVPCADTIHIRRCDEPQLPGKRLVGPPTTPHSAEFVGATDVRPNCGVGAGIW